MGRNFEKKWKHHKFHPKMNLCRQEVSSKSDNGKVFKNRKDGFWENGGNSGFEKKNENVTNVIPK